MRVALKYTGLLVMVLASAFAFGQNYRQGVKQGNKLYENQEYAKLNFHPVVLKNKMIDAVVN